MSEKGLDSDEKIRKSYTLTKTAAECEACSVSNYGDNCGLLEVCCLADQNVALKSKRRDCVSREEPEKDIAKSCVEHGTPSSKDGCAKCHWESIVGLQKELASLKSKHSDCVSREAWCCRGLRVEKAEAAIKAKEDELSRCLKALDSEEGKHRLTQGELADLRQAIKDIRLPGES